MNPPIRTAGSRTPDPGSRVTYPGHPICGYASDTIGGLHMVQPEPVCAYCRRHPVDPAWRPFCSERCKLADLGRWISDGYRIPGPPLPVDDEDIE